MTNEKTYTISHNDFDGIGCGILIKLAYPDHKVIYSGLEMVNKHISEFIEKEKYNEYDNLYITDIAGSIISAENAEKLDELQREKKVNVVFIDHHPSTGDMLKYDWATIRSKSKIPWDEREEVPQSGTSLLYLHLLDNSPLLSELSKHGYSKNTLLHFVETVREYDSWEWYNYYEDDTPKKWNDLFYILGVSRFEKKIKEKLSKLLIFDELETTLLEIEDNRMKHYIQSKEKTMTTHVIAGHTAGVVFAESYHSELGNVLATNHPDLAFIVIINPSRSISYRGVKTDIDLGKDVASLFGGGGHPQASGSPLNKDLVMELIDKQFLLNEDKSGDVKCKNQ